MLRSFLSSSRRLAWLLLFAVPLSSAAFGQNAPNLVDGMPDRSTPRRAVWSFLWWLQHRGDQWRPDLAAQCLDGSNVGQQDSAREDLAIQLKRWLDAKGLYIGYSQLPDDPDHRDSTGQNLYRLSGNPEFQQVYLSKREDLWLFSPETVEAIPKLYRQEFPVVADFLLDHLPSSFQSDIPILGVRLWQIVGLVCLVLLSVLLGQSAKWMLEHPIRRIVSRTKTSWDDLVIDAVSKPARILVTTASLAISFPFLMFVSLNQFAGSAFTAIAIFCLVWSAYRLSEGLIQAIKKKAQASPSPIDDHLIPLFRVGLRIVVIALGGVFILQSVGINVGALVAGLGIGGLAVALAAQSLLSDLFASASIALDKPFTHGDFIIFGSFLGTVEYIGLKTTKVRSLAGEQLVFSNADLVKGPIQNFKRMRERRAVFAFGVTYQITPEKLEAIPGIVKEIILSQEKSRFDRCHFKSYGDSSLDFEVVYWVMDPDYNVYMDIQQAINTAIFRRFASEKIDFAYPTRTVWIEKS